MFSVSKRPTISEIQDLYKTKKALPSQVLQFFFNRSTTTDKQIKAFNYYTPKLAEIKAAQLDEILENYSQKYSPDKWFEVLIQEYPLFGVPYSVKSIILVEGETFNAGSKILDHFKAPYSSTVYEKVDRAGGLMIGINHMDQFAMGSSGETSDYATTRNPFDTTRIAGGSSSGPIAAVASGQVVFSLGTDTGGSIRQPAAFCDVVGLKPTYGLVSRFGVIPMASSLDQVGPITNTVEDNIILTKILAGKDIKDQTSIESHSLVTRLDKVLEDKKQTRQIKKLHTTTKPLKIGIPKEFYVDGIHPIILKAMQELQEKLAELGHTLVDVSIPLSKYAISVYYMTMPVEVAANLERIDGVRYAWQQEKYDNLYFQHRGQYFGDEAKRRIMLGTYVSSAGYYDAYYNRAQKVRELARRDFIRVFEEVDVLLTPTTPEFPFKIGEKTTDPLKMYLSDVFTCGINPVRIPGLTVPLGLFDVQNGEKVKVELESVEIDTSEDGQTVVHATELDTVTSGTVKLPTGCQILGPELSEDVIFRLAQEIEMVVSRPLN
jgi:aspartyl-tRNA(Asn)/glutamyl-tRNA(Gln) amidotransferase subunit A